MSTTDTVQKGEGVLLKQTLDVIKANQVNPTYVNLSLTGLLFESAIDAQVAHAGGGQANALAINFEVNRIVTVASAADSVVLPASSPGLTICLINTGANQMQVFGLSPDLINDQATGTGVSQMPGSLEFYVCPVAGKWYVDIGTGFSGSLVTDSYTDSIVAATGGQGGATQLTTIINRISTVAVAGYGVKLPAAAGGVDLLVINHGANAMQVYGLGADTIDDQTNTVGVSQMANSVVLYMSAGAGKWYSEGLATGFGGPGLQTLSFTPNMTADVNNTQAGAIANAAMTTMVNRFGTVAAQGNGGALPAAVVGLSITVVNRGAFAMQVYGNTGDTINGIATATGVSQGVNTYAVYTCNVAGNWEVPITALVSPTPVVLAGDGAIPPHVQHVYVITKGSAAALTLAAPTAGADDGNTITIFSSTAFAHVLTATGLLNTGSANHNTATWAAQLGGSLTLWAYGGKWYAEAQVGITFG
jgi:hypothetical protein